MGCEIMAYKTIQPNEGTVTQIFPKRNSKSRHIHGLVKLDGGEVTEFSGYFDDRETREVMIGTRIRGTRYQSKDRTVLRNAERKW